MKNKLVLLILLILLLLSESFTQTIYELTPGTKGNEIMLTVANVSETSPAANVTIKPHPTLSKGEGFQEKAITFHQSEQTIEILNPKEEKEVTFVFDVSRNAQINKKDTIEFMITNPDGIMMTKQFVFGYAGPKEFKLEQNFPNPFNPITTIQYQIPASPKSSPKERTSVTLRIYDILGSEVATLINDEQEAGYYEVNWDASNLASGVYIYRLQTGSFVSVKKMMLLR
jgi:hypothetical protein